VIFILEPKGKTLKLEERSRKKTRRQLHNKRIRVGHVQEQRGKNSILPKLGRRKVGEKGRKRKKVPNKKKGGDDYSAVPINRLTKREDLGKGPSEGKTWKKNRSGEFSHHNKRKGEHLEMPQRNPLSKGGTGLQKWAQ